MGVGDLLLEVVEVVDPLSVPVDEAVCVEVRVSVRVGDQDHTDDIIGRNCLITPCQSQEREDEGPVREERRGESKKG